MKYHLIGICGTGMGALAGLLKQSGHDVRGSDSGVYPPMSNQLAAAQIQVFEGYAPKNLDWQPDIVIVGNACRKDHVEVLAAQERNLPLTSLPAVLGEEFLKDRHSIVVTGTHGKTTTTSLVTHILKFAAAEPSWLIGGVPANLHRGYGLGSGPAFVVEGDEYDSAFFDKGSKFLHYHPDTAIMTSLEFDHGDIFTSLEQVRETFTKFLHLLPQDGLLVVCHSSEEAMELAASDANCRIESYGTADKVVDGSATWLAKDIEQLRTGRCRFTVHRNGEFFEQFEILLAGNHNVENAVAAIAVAASQGIAAPTIKKALASFAGIRRRQEVRGIAQGVYVLDDYAHHPTAVNETLIALRNRFARRRIIVLFEPRSATSRRNIFQDDYVDALVHADMAIIGEPYDTSRIPEAERLDPEQIVRDLHLRGTKSSYIPSVDGIVEHLKDQLHPGDVVAIMSCGAFGGLHDKLLQALGDPVRPARVTDIEPIKQQLEEQTLLTDGIDTNTIGDFLTLYNETGFVGCVGLEVFGEEAILRSLSIREDARGIGYGWLLADTVITVAKHRGVKRLYLITESAADFFAEKHGFTKIDRSTVSAAVSNSITFRSEKQDAAAMRLDLQ